MKKLINWIMNALDSIGRYPLDVHPGVEVKTKYGNFRIVEMDMSVMYPHKKTMITIEMTKVD